MPHIFLVICINGFEHCGISWHFSTIPTLHYELSTTEGYVTKGLLPYGRVTPQRFVASYHLDKRIKIYGQCPQTSLITQLPVVVPEGFLLRFFLAGLVSVRKPYPMLFRVVKTLWVLSHCPVISSVEFLSLA